MHFFLKNECSLQIHPFTILTNIQWYRLCTTEHTTLFLLVPVSVNISSLAETWRLLSFLLQSPFLFLCQRVPAHLSNPFKHHLTMKSFSTPSRVILLTNSLQSVHISAIYLISSLPLFPPFFPFSNSLWSSFGSECLPSRNTSYFISIIQLPVPCLPHIKMCWMKVFSKNRMSCDWITWSSKQVGDTPGSALILCGFKLQSCYF